MIDGTERTPLYACIGLTEKDTLALIVVPDESVLPSGGLLFLRTVKILARYQTYNPLWLRLEDLYWELYNPLNIEKSALLSQWMANTIGIGAGMMKGNDRDTGDMIVPEFDGNDILSDPDLVIMLWDVGVMLVHYAAAYGIQNRPPKSIPDNRLIMMDKVRTD
ncbi:hypothetical protein HQ524_00260 [Candidatus Uhrbacteria bacterium]|nr:hypothetical protein [Candidatus Uhrbacteria bacterium]